MWFGTVEMEQLRSRSLWKVEFYSEPACGEVASGYPLVVLGDIVSERKESLDPVDYPDVEFNYLGLEHVESLTGDLVGFSPRVGREILSRSKVFRSGDLLYGRLRPYLNKVYAACGAVREGICSGEFFVLVPNDRVCSARLLRLLLASALVREAVARWQVGSTHPRLRLPDLLSLRVPLPPAEDQLQLEAFLANTEKRRREMAHQAKQLPHAVEAEVLRGLAAGSASGLNAQVGPAVEPEDFGNALPGEAFGRERIRARARAPLDSLVASLVSDHVKSRKRS